MEGKDVIAAAGIILTFLVGGAGILFTFIVGIWNLVLTYRVARNTRYGSLVTAERLKWISELRTTMSQFCGRVQTWMALVASSSTPDPQEAPLRKEINRLGYHIRLLLDSRWQPDQEIESLVAAITNSVAARSLTGLQVALEEIAGKTQAHMNREWGKVKAEADKGKLGR